MPTYQKRFRVSDGTDSSDFVHSEIFESFPEKVGLNSFYKNDEFNSSTQQNIKNGGDGAKSYGWNILNSANADAIDVNITNVGSMTIDANAVSTDAYMGGFNTPFVYKTISGDFDVEMYISASNADASYEGIGLCVRDPNASTGEDHIKIMSHYRTGMFIGSIQTTNSNSINETNTSGTFPYIRIVRIGNNFYVYYKATAEASWTLQQTFTRNDFASNVQIGILFQTVNASNTLVCQVDYFRFNNGTPDKSYPSNSPSPGQVWEAVATSSVVKWSTARLLIYKNGTVQAATNTDVKLQYAVNGGAFNGTWLTLSGLKGISDTSITDAINSVKLKGQYNSNGDDKVESNVYMVVDVDASAGGGISKARLINTGGF